MVAITFRTTDNTKWGTGSGAGTGGRLTASQVDINFWNLKQAVETLQADLPAAAVGIEDFTVEGNQFYVLLTDGSQQGPYDLPVIQWNFRDDWLPSTVYSPNDVVTVGNSFYIVLWPHTSATNFDPAANDGNGHAYYLMMLNLEGAGMPTGGTTGQVLTKNSNTDFDATWQDAAGGGGAGLDVVLNYTSSQLVPSGDLDTDPAGATPAWNYHDWTYSASFGGYLWISYTGTENMAITIPVTGLVVGQWYAVDFQCYFDGAYAYIYDGSYVQQFVNGSTSFLFKATTTSPTFNLVVSGPAANFYGEIYNFTINKVDATGPVAITDGVHRIAGFGYDHANIFIGGANANWLTDAQYGTTYYSNIPYGNVAIGQSALTNINTGETRNIAIGQLALTSCTADDNIGIGFAALSNSWGYENIAVGSYALGALRDGSHNIVMGNGVGPRMVDSYMNIILGMYAADQLVSGQGNVLIGEYVAAYLKSDYNVVIGHQAGSTGTNYLSTGGKNVFIGWHTRSSKPAVANSIALGADAVVTADDTVQLGDTGVKRAYVGNKAIGKPQHLLVTGSSAGNFTVSGITYSGGIPDRLDEVIYYPGAGGVFDLTSEFTITSNDTINNTGGTDTTGGKLIVRWTSLN